MYGIMHHTLEKFESQLSTAQQSLGMKVLGQLNHVRNHMWHDGHGWRYPLPLSLIESSVQLTS